MLCHVTSRETTWRLVHTSSPWDVTNVARGLPTVTQWSVGRTEDVMCTHRLFQKMAQSILLSQRKTVKEDNDDEEDMFIECYVIYVEHVQQLFDPNSNSEFLDFE